MFDWFKVALLFLQIANRIADIVRERGQMDAGKDSAIARESAAILLKTQSAKEIMAQVTAMTDAQVDAALKELEPK